MANILHLPPAGAFDPADITLTDDTSGALLIKEGSNEYMRINTTNSAEQTIFANGTSNQYIKIDATSGQPGVTIKMPSGVPLRFQADKYQGLSSSGSVYRAFSISAANNWAFGDMTGSSPGYLQGYASDIRIVHQSSSGSNSGVKMRARGAGTGDTFKIQSNTETNFEISQDSDATFTLDASGASVFKVQDDAGTPNEFLKIDSDTSASLIEFNVPSGQGAGMTVNLPADGGSNTGFQILPPSGGGLFRFGRQTTHFSTGTQLEVSVGVANLKLDGTEFRLQSSTPDIVMNLDSSSVDFKVTDSADATILEVKEDSSLAHILDSGSSATFEVKHDAMTTTYNQFFKAQEGIGTLITPGDGSSIQICNNSTALNGNERLIIHYYQNTFLEQHQMPKWKLGIKSTTSSAASSSLNYDLRLGRSHSQGHVRTLINSTYSGTHAFTANFENTLSNFAGNQDWGVTSQILRFENSNTSNGATLQFGVVTGGSIKFVNNSGTTTGITDPVSGTQALAAKGSAAAGTYSLLVYRLTQFNTMEGSASLHDDDRYIIELLYAELI